MEIRTFVFHGKIAVVAQHCREHDVGGLPIRARVL